MPAQAHQRPAPTPAQSLREYARGVAGGLLFSLPVLYTMEVWWTGFMAGPERLLAGLAATYALLLLYNRFAGLHASASWREVAIDSVEEMGLGLLLAAALLWLLGELSGDLHIDELMGKIVIEGFFVAVGVSVGTAQLGASGDDEEANSQGMEGDDGNAPPAFGSQVGLALCGAFLVASNVAPTEEIVQIASEAALSRLLGIAALSIALTALVLYFSDFRGGHAPDKHGGALGVLRGTIVTYAIALAASAFLLWFFSRFEGASLLLACSQIVVLGLPAAVGASAGRLLLQQASQ